MIIRTFAATAAALAILALAATSAAAATPSTPFDVFRVAAFDPQPEGRFGDRMKSAGDLDGDGIGDIWIGDYNYDADGLRNVGRVHAVSGRDRSRLYHIDSPEPQGQPTPEGAFFGFGWSVSNLGDVNGDGVNDLVVGSVRHNVNPTTGQPCEPGAAGCHVQQGRAWVFSGKPGKQDAPLYVLDNPRPQAFGAFGWASTAGDIALADGSPGHDGKSEIIVGAFQNDNPRGCGGPPPAPAPADCRKDQGQAFIFNGANGQLLPDARGVVDVPTEDQYVDPVTKTCDSQPRPTAQLCGALGIVTEGLGDVNGDGFWDQSVSAWTTGVNPATGAACLGTLEPCNERQGRIYVYSGVDGTLLHKIDNPEPQEGALFGLQIVEAGAPGDVNGDGKADIYGNGFVQNTAQTEHPAEGKSWVFNGPDGRVLYGLTDPTPEPGGQFGYSLAKTDYDNDGSPDLYIGSSPHHEPGSAQLGGTYVFGGKTGSLMRIFDLPPSDVQVGTADNNGPQLGRGIAAPGDLNRDGEPDYVASAPTYDIGSIRNVGRLYAFLSAPLASAPPATPPVTPPVAAQPGLFTAKLAIARARILRRDRRLDVLAPITSLASGRARVELHAANQRFRFTAPVNSRDGRIRFSKRIPKSQADLGTGIVTIRYLGDADTRPQTVRLRAASQKANLRLSRPTISNGRVRASGTVDKRARGVVRVQIQYVVAGKTSTLQFKARIANGKWSLNESLSQTVRTAIAQRTGTVHSYTLFTGYFQRRIRGEMRSFQVLGSR